MLNKNLKNKKKFGFKKSPRGANLGYLSFCLSVYKLQERFKRGSREVQVRFK